MKIALPSQFVEAGRACQTIDGRSSSIGSHGCSLSSLGDFNVATKPALK